MEHFHDHSRAGSRSVSTIATGSRRHEFNERGSGESSRTEDAAATAFAAECGAPPRTMAPGGGLSSARLAGRSFWFRTSTCT